jgi:putative hydrolase of the HAD superfamily
LLIWDFEGTLGYREGGMFGSAMLELLRREMSGLEVDAEQLRPYLQTGFPWHRPDRPHPEIETSEAWWNSLAPVFESGFRGIGVGTQRARSLAQQVRHVYAAPSRWRLFDQALPTLDRLTVRGWTHVLLSNHVPELRDIVDHLGLTSRLARIFNSAETGYEKPHPRAFRMVLDAFPDATVVWMIGDSVAADVAGAERIGIPAILIHAESGEAGRVCAALSELEAIVSEEP